MSSCKIFTYCKLIIAAVCVVVAGAGAAVYFLVIRKKKDGPDNTDGPAEGDSSDMDGKAE